MNQLPFLPTEASTSAVQVDTVFLVLLALALFFTLLVAALILYFGIKYRRRAPNEIGKPPPKGMAVEWLGMGVLVTLALAMYFWAGGIYTRLFNPPPDAMPIFVTGKQWMWKAQQPTGQREINTVHVPTGRPIKLILTSEDVIHDFYVPAFRIKTDVIPGRYSTLWFEATQPGTYHLFCSQYCGLAHSEMVGDVIVMTPADYQAWLGGGPQQSPAQIGAGMFQSLGCSGCHRSDSQARAPNLAGLYGQPVHLDNNQTVTADDAYIRESILNPNAKVVSGFQRPSIMPSFQGRVSEEQIFDLIAYIQSLGGSGAQGAPAGTALPGGPAAPVLATPGILPGGPASTPAGGTQTASPNQPLGPTPATAVGAPSAADVTAGQALFASNACIGCHVPTGGGAGPSLVGVFGSQVPLASGQTVTADEAYVRESILNPTAKVVQGFQPIMPSFQGKLSDAQINQLIAYIESLKK